MRQRRLMLLQSKWQETFRHGALFNFVFCKKVKETFYTPKASEFSSSRPISFEVLEKFAYGLKRESLPRSFDDDDIYRSIHIIHV